MVTHIRESSIRTKKTQKGNTTRLPTLDCKKPADCMMLPGWVVFIITGGGRVWGEDHSCEKPSLFPLKLKDMNGHGSLRGGIPGTIADSQQVPYLHPCKPKL